MGVFPSRTYLHISEQEPIPIENIEIVSPVLRAKWNKRAASRAARAAKRKAMKDQGIEPPLLAYSVLEDCENTGTIVFARHAIVARRRGAEEVNGGELCGMRCRRAPWADAYADRGVPAGLAVEHGWRFECQGCGRTCERDSLADDDILPEEMIGTVDSTVFCRTTCKAEYDDRECRKAVQATLMIETLKDWVRRRYGDVTFVTGFGNEHTHLTSSVGDGFMASQIKVSFEFPGMTIAPATASYDDSSRRWVIGGYTAGPMPVRVTVCAGDLAAFEAWATSISACNR